MKVIVEALSGQALELEVEETCQISELKAILATRLNVPSVLLSLTSNGLPLDNDELLANLSHGGSEPLCMQSVVVSEGIVTKNTGITKVRCILDAMLPFKGSLQAASLTVTILESLAARPRMEEVRKKAMENLSEIMPIDGGSLVQRLREAGYNPNEIRSCGFSLSLLAEAGHADANLTAGGQSLAELKEAGYTILQLFEGGCNFTGEQLREVGYTARQMRKVGYALDQLKEAGCNARQLKDADYALLQISRMRVILLQRSGMQAFLLHSSSMQAMRFHSSRMRAILLQSSRMRAILLQSSSMRAMRF
eukprot:TRINITY_DN8331_c0_g1_i11.p1 TRINITY_DN8331_c0_g1~~TRINITY_DN8331_c0_g1_i11.p1  ORF type:complete len:308 (-),score=67.41 TRINITY_DN8331_c0_g1_i11:285-1208(-)